MDGMRGGSDWFEGDTAMAIIIVMRRNERRGGGVLHVSWHRRVALVDSRYWESVPVVLDGPEVLLRLNHTAVDGGAGQTY